QGDFREADATSFSNLYQEKFDAVMSLMVFPCMEKKEMIVESLRETKRVLTENGKVIIGVTHPCFDFYMQKYLFDRPDVDADFKSYFRSGDKMKIHKQFKDGIMTFQDYHWLIEDYISAITAAGLKLTAFDECRPDLSKKVEWDSTFTEQRLLIPTYLVLVCEKR
ncbi:MAG: class I SAM-dependent methyltransferase, partial [Patescibacteria group bacterium]|nr:class I SAM-dependent methyltransferase [Patescibacteria group bacterium]